MTLDINSVQFEEVYGFRCINLTLLGKQFGKLPQKYFKTKKCATWIRANNESLSTDWNKYGEYINPDSFYFTKRVSSRTIYYTKHQAIAYDFIHYCSNAWAFKNTIRLTELWYNPNKYDSNLEAEILGKRVMDNFIDSIDIDEMFSILKK